MNASLVAENSPTNFADDDSHVNASLKSVISYGHSFGLLLLEPKKEDDHSDHLDCVLQDAASSSGTADARTRRRRRRTRHPISIIDGFHAVSIAFTPTLCTTLSNLLRNHPHKWNHIRLQNCTGEALLDMISVAIDLSNVVTVDNNYDNDHPCSYSTFAKYGTSLFFGWSSHNGIKIIIRNSTACTWIDWEVIQLAKKMRPNRLRRFELSFLDISPSTTTTSSAHHYGQGLCDLVSCQRWKQVVITKIYATDLSASTTLCLRLLTNVFQHSEHVTIDTDLEEILAKSL